MATNPLLPPEYQGELDQLQKQQMLAQLLQKQAFNPQMPQSQGRMAARVSPLQTLSQALTGYLGMQGEAKAQQSVRGVQQKYIADENTALDQFAQAPEDQQQLLGMKSQFSRVQELAKALQAQRQKRLEGFAASVKDVAPGDAANAHLTGKLPTGPYVPPAIPGIEEKTDGSGNPYLVRTNRTGEKIPTFAPKAPTTNVNIPKQENQFSLSLLENQLKPREEAATAAKNVLASTTRAVDSLSRGALAGGGEGIKQGLRKTLQAFGVTPSATAETEELKMALGSAILNEAAKIKPISNTDIETLRGIVGSIDTDPNALTRALAFMQAEAIRGLQGFNKYVTEQGSTLTDPLARQRLSGITIGNELPKQLYGPQTFQMAVMQALQQGGGDVSAFGQSGAAFPPDAQFSIKNPAAGFPVAKRNVPAGDPPGWSKLTPAEQAEYLRLKGRQ